MKGMPSSFPCDIMILFGLQQVSQSSIKSCLSSIVRSIHNSFSSPQYWQTHVNTSSVVILVLQKIIFPSINKEEFSSKASHCCYSANRIKELEFYYSWSSRTYQHTYTFMDLTVISLRLEYIIGMIFDLH
jgi:hypothetical protein